MDIMTAHYGHVLEKLQATLKSEQEAGYKLLAHQSSRTRELADTLKTYREALKMVTHKLAQPIDRISEITLQSYGELRQSILDIATTALKEGER